MKKSVFLLFLLSAISIFSQSIEKKEFDFSTIDTFPIYEGCENVENNSERKKCLDEKLSQHIQNNFNYALANCLKKKTVYGKNKRQQKKCVAVLLPGEKRIYLDFKINSEGGIEIINARAPHDKLKQETIRVGHLIPNILPAQKNGESIAFDYTIPIDFTVK